MAQAESDIVVEVRDLSRSFGKKEALRGVSLHVHRGEVFGLVGDSVSLMTYIVLH